MRKSVSHATAAGGLPRLSFIILVLFALLAPGPLAAWGRAGQRESEPNPTGMAATLSTAYKSCTKGVPETGFDGTCDPRLRARQANREEYAILTKFHAQEHRQHNEAADKDKAELWEENLFEHRPAPMQSDAPGYVPFDDKLRPVTEPTKASQVIRREKVKDTWQSSPGDIRRIVLNEWTLRPDDFKVGKMRTITVRDHMNPDRAYTVLPFTITNSNSRGITMAPLFYMLSTDIHDKNWERAERTPQVGGYFIRQMFRETLLREVISEQDLLGYVRNDFDGMKKLVGVFEAGETKSGVVIFEKLPRRLDKMKVVIEGLNRTPKYAKRLRRVLALDYERTGDEYGPFEPLRFKENRWAHWEWFWMWDQDISIPPAGEPVLVTLRPTTETGGRTKNFWYYLYRMRNSTDEPQKFEIASFDTIVEVELNGFDRDGEPCKVEVVFPDDGRQTVEIERVLRSILGLRSTDPVPDPGRPGMKFAGWLQPYKRHRHVRAPEPVRLEKKQDEAVAGRPNPEDDPAVWLKPGEMREGLVIFDESACDIEHVYQQVEDWLNRMSPRDLYRTEDPAPSPPAGWLSDRLVYPQRPPRRRLTAQEKELVRNQLEAKIREQLAVEQKRVRHILARVTARCGLSSGTFRIDRHYVVKAEYNRSWIRWEEGWWTPPYYDGDVRGESSKRVPRFKY